MMLMMMMVMMMMMMMIYWLIYWRYHGDVPRGKAVLCTTHALN